ncbi:transmembrane protein 68-like [Nilaparvata lugens]|uniref:transmembrane protein 68-like n=1 Tax=Nilaparvata lugens TaxID=108931 RepID=UPI00193CE3CC|nr:transmembrane protein 68-like [Nilaparvata lugens]
MIINDWFPSVDHLLGNVDLGFILWLLSPLLVTFLLPFVIVFLLYSTAVIMYIYKFHRHRLQHAYDVNVWHGALKTCSAIWDAHGWIWHGYTVQGLQNIPQDTPALLVYYHGAIPIDLYYLISKIYLLKNRLVHTVADRFLFKVPGFGILTEALKVIPGTVQTCSTVLKSNNLLAISPGGVYEAQFGDSYYDLLWKKRVGFAKVALESQVPIVPVFTVNVREAFRTISVGKRFWLRLYSWLRFPMMPIYGGFPVKLTTHIGKPIAYDGSLTPEQLQVKVLAAMRDLIETNQRIPGSIMRGLMERWITFPTHCKDE